MIAVVVVVLVLAIAAAVARKSFMGGPLQASNPDSHPSVGIESGRLILYGVSFIGLMGALFAAMGLVSVGLAQTVFASHNLMSPNDARNQLSYFLAALI